MRASPPTARSRGSSRGGLEGQRRQRRLQHRGMADQRWKAITGLVVAGKPVTRTRGARGRRKWFRGHRGGIYPEPGRGSVATEADRRHSASGAAVRGVACALEGSGETKVARADPDEE